jgi:hypothetical protein
MSRLREDPSGSENDEFPDLDTLVHRARKGKKSAAQPSTKAIKASSARRRKLGPVADNALLKPWTQLPPSTVDATKPRSRPRVQLRTKKQEPTIQVTAIDDGEQGHRDSYSVEVAFDNWASADDSSEFHDPVSLDLYGSDDSNHGTKSKYAETCASPSKHSRTQGPGRTIVQRKASPKKLDQRGTANKSRQGEDTALSRLTGATIQDADLVGAINRLYM